jgi:uncharacterized protein YdhG (YjbR/CyaY superfamily)
MSDVQKSAKNTTAKDKTYDGFTDEERSAMKERAKELKTTVRRGSRASKADGESEVLGKIAEMQEPDRVLAERLYAVIKASAPGISPTTWYGMPAYAKDGKVVCFFQPAQKFKIEVRDAWLQRQREPRRRRHVAGLLRRDGADRHRRGKDRRAREESRELSKPWGPSARAARAQPAGAGSGAADVAARQSRSSLSRWGTWTS